MLEARADDPLHKAYARVLFQHRFLVDAVGLYPDIEGLLDLTRLGYGDLARALEIDMRFIPLWSSGGEGFPCRAAVVLAEYFEWPFAAFFRGRHNWHERTWISIAGLEEDEDGPILPR